MAELQLRFQKYLGGHSLAEEVGVLTNVYPAAATGARPKTKGVRGITIPVGTAETFRTVELPAGDYLVECVLPSGEVVTQDVELVEGPPTQVVMHGSDSPHEWLSWQQYSGNILAQQVYSPAPIEKERVFAPAIRDLLESAHDTPATAIPDFSQPASQALEAAANPMWHELFQDSGTGPIRMGDAPPDVSEPLEIVDGLVLDGLFEIADGTVRAEWFDPARQWETLDRFTSRDAGQPLAELMRRCLAAKQGQGDAAGIRWLKPYESDQATRAYNVQPADDLSLRYFISWSPAGAELISLPREWTNVFEHHSVPIDVMVDVVPADRPFRASITVQDTSLSSAFSYLTAGALPTAGRLFDRARDMLYTKVSNPYAAAAGAYILLETRDPDPNEDWTRWIENLQNQFKWLPDGAVLYGWLKLKTAEHDLAHHAFKEAFQRGLPLYSAGLKKLIDGLKLFAPDDDETRDMVRSVRSVAWRANMRQAFTVVRLGPPAVPTKVKEGR